MAVGNTIYRVDGLNDRELVSAHFYVKRHFARLSVSMLPITKEQNYMLMAGRFNVSCLHGSIL